MKKLFFLLLLSNIGLLHSQTYVKFNGATALVAIPHVGVETSIGKKTTLQVDLLGSFWESFNGSPIKAVMLFPEVRYHFHEKFNGFYAGAHIGGGAYEIQKWNYANTDKYQKGYSLYLGATIGYEWKLNDKWMLDIFVGGGSQSGAYKGYYKSTGERYDGAKKFNKSGEWLPYRGGVMISYKL